MSIDEVLANQRPWWVDKADCLEWLPFLPSDCVDLLVTSPPYVDARLYLEDGEDLGIARDADEWVAWMIEICEAARRVCKGLCVFVVEGKTSQYRYDCTPFLLIADLHRKGFHLRKPPIYCRNGIMGSGGPDWLRNDWEPCVCFTRGGRLSWSDNTAMGHPPKYGVGGRPSHRTADGSRVTERYRGGKLRNSYREEFDRFISVTTSDGKLERQAFKNPEIANPGNVIDCGAVGGGHMGGRLAHENEAPFPEYLAEFFIRSFCPEGGLVCDPFAGSGTTLAVARRWGRRAVGCDLRQSQVELTRRRVLEEASLFDELDNA